MVCISGCIGNKKPEDLSYKADRQSTIAVSRNIEWTKKWWSARHTKILKDIKTKKIDLLMLGDSITHRWNRKVFNQFYGERNAYNIGFSEILLSMFYGVYKMVKWKV